MRPSKIRHYMNIAKAVAERCTCKRVQIGAIIVKEDQIISTGYIGAPRKTKDCLERNSCLREDLNIPHGQRYELCRSVHAEQNAIINASRAGTSILGGDLFLYGISLPDKKPFNAIPCFFCKKMIINAGLKRFFSHTENGEIETFYTEEWIRNWKEKDLIDDKQQYGTDQNSDIKNSKFKNQNFNKNNQTKIFALVGMTGSGKSLVSDYLIDKGWGYVRFGQLTLDIVKERGLEPTEKNEKPIREELREKHGMAAFATLNIPKFDQVLTEKNLVADGLYSWSEYKVLKNYYGDRLKIIAIYAPPKNRYNRLEKRQLKDDDKELKNRPASPTQAKSRDYAEIENIEKGGPIAMADFTILNTKDINFVYQQIEDILNTN